jgi:primary-amine oxidase
MMWRSASKIASFTRTGRLRAFSSKGNEIFKSRQTYCQSNSIFSSSHYIHPTQIASTKLFFTTDIASTSSHPLDPLTAEEIKCTSLAVKDYLSSAKDRDPSSIRFISVSLCEPAKKDLLSVFDKTDDISIKIRRKAEVITLLDGICSELIVDLSSEADAKVIDHVDLPAGIQPMFTPDDCDLAEEIAKRSPEVQQAVLERYGIKDVEKELVCDPWSVHLADENDKSLTLDEHTGSPRRLIQTFLYQRMLNIDTLEDNHYAHPIDIVPVVDLNTGTVVRIDGMDRPPPKIPDLSVNYHQNLISTNSYLQTEWREERLKELNIVQPDGPSFDVDGNRVSWQDWSFFVGFNYREGLVLHDVKYQGRNVIHRASLVEMSVPYGDPHPPFQRKCAFDVGDYGLGYCANSLELGCDW